MPDTTTPKPPFIARRSNTLLVLAAISVTFMLFYPHIIRAQGTSQQACLNPTVVDTFSGTGSQTTPVFNTTGQSFRISYDATSTEQGVEGFLGIIVNSGDGEIVNTASQEGAGSGQSFVNAGPGSYTLDISSVFLQYDITVEDCNGGGSGGEEQVQDRDVDNGVTDEQYEDDVEDQQTPATGGPPLSVVAALIIWFGVGGILVARRFA